MVLRRHSTGTRLGPGDMLREPWAVRKKRRARAIEGGLRASDWHAKPHVSVEVLVFHVESQAPGWLGCPGADELMRGRWGISTERVHPGPDVIPTPPRLVRLQLTTDCAVCDRREHGDHRLANARAGGTVFATPVAPAMDESGV